MIQQIRRFRADLRILEREITDTLDTQTDCCGVTVSQCHILMELDGAGCVKLIELANSLGLDKSTLSRAVDSLVQLGWVDRSIDPDNRRAQIICLSVTGKAKVEDINQRCDRDYQDLLQRIPAEKHAEIIASLGLLAKAMQDRTKETRNGCCWKS